jgi:hypothetical protein
MKTWEEFNTRFTPVRNDLGKDPLDFYGCVNAEGDWFDSSESFDIAVHWCCYSAGAFDEADEIEWMATEGRKRGYSIIHGTMLKQMYEKGLIK